MIKLVIFTLIILIYITYCHLRTLYIQKKDMEDITNKINDLNKNIKEIESSINELENDINKPNK